MDETANHANVRRHSLYTEEVKADAGVTELQRGPAWRLPPLLRTAMGDF